MTTAGGLPAELVAVLRFEARAANMSVDQRTELVRQAFGISLTRYHQRLLRAVHTAGAEAVEPATVYRLRRTVEARRTRLTRPQPHTPPGATP